MFGSVGDLLKKLRHAGRVFNPDEFISGKLSVFNDDARLRYFENFGEVLLEIFLGLAVSRCCFGLRFYVLPFDVKLSPEALGMTLIFSIRSLACQS